MTTDTSERGLERHICTVLAGHPCDPRPDGTEPTPQDGYGGAGWTAGNPNDYDRGHCIDLVQLTAFLRDTQEDMVEALGLEEDGPTRRQFLARLEGEITKRGTIDVLRHGIKHRAHRLDLFYGTPSPGNAQARTRFEANRFSVTRQLRYSRIESQRALDLGLFINGLPIATFELKNSLTKQTVADAELQYKNDRDDREKLFAFGRCVAHFAVDEQEVRFCTHLKGRASWFLPFNCGWNDGAGNPPNPDGLKTDYLWHEVLTRQSLTNILENYAQVVESGALKSGRKTKQQIWPRYHQLDVVRRLLADAREQGVGQRYLIQHSAGSGKSNSIAWLAHQLIGLEHEAKLVFDSVVVVTDRRLLDKQINDTIKQYAQVRATVGHADRSGDLRQFLESGKKIIISTVQKFPFILDEIGNSQRGRRFAIIIDEAHSSQGGKVSAAMATALSEAGASEDGETYEDQINRVMEARKLLPNASYLAFTATPKNKTLELFGAAEPQPDGTVKHRPFHSYTMKQAIQEGFILDVLRYYTPVKSYYQLAKRVEDDPEFDAGKAQRKLRRFVEGHDHAIRQKAEIMVDHFHDQVIGRNKIGGQARAMVVTNGVREAIQYVHAIRAYLRERKSPYNALVAFSGEHEYNGARVTETSLNEFPSTEIASRFQEDPYRWLVCADKFQTGYDEPLLHTMYVDKTLFGIKAVQTLSRLNRAHPKKSDVFILDFRNDADTIEEAFVPFYRTTGLADETDPNKLHNLQADLDGYQVYAPEQIKNFVRLYLDGAERKQLDPILDACVPVYRDLDEDGQVEFKSMAKTFTRTYAFLASVLPYSNAEWEERSIFLNFLVSKLPAPGGEDLSQGILDHIDMDTYRIEVRKARQIELEDDGHEIQPVPISPGGGRPDARMERLSAILKTFNEQFGDFEWTDADRVRRLITEEIPARVAEDPAYRHAKASGDRQNARIEHDAALGRVMTAVVNDDIELFKQFTDNPAFKSLISDASFDLTFGEH